MASSVLWVGCGGALDASFDMGSRDGGSELLDSSVPDIGPMGPPRFLWTNVKPTRTIVAGDDRGRTFILNEELMSFKSPYTTRLPDRLIRGSMSLTAFVGVLDGGGVFSYPNPINFDRIRFGGQELFVSCVSLEPDGALACNRKGATNDVREAIDLGIQGVVRQIEFGGGGVIVLFEDGRAYDVWLEETPLTPDPFPNPPYKHVSTSVLFDSTTAVRQDGVIEFGARMATGAWDVIGGMRFEGYERAWVESDRRSNGTGFLMCAERSDHSVRCFASDFFGPVAMVQADPIPGIEDVRLGPDGLHMLNRGGFCYITAEGELDCRHIDPDHYALSVPRLPPEED